MGSAFSCGKNPGNDDSGEIEKKKKMNRSVTIH
jgi:hypothetical protein